MSLDRSDGVYPAPIEVNDFLCRSSSCTKTPLTEEAPLLDSFIFGPNAGLARRRCGDCFFASSATKRKPPASPKFLRRPRAADIDRQGLQRVGRGVAHVPILRASMGAWRQSLDRESRRRAGAKPDDHASHSSPSSTATSDAARFSASRSASLGNAAALLTWPRPRRRFRGSP